MQEWGELTVSDQFISDYKNNFYEIVSPRNERLYYRDLPLLLNLSMKLSDIDLVLNLGKQMISYDVFMNGIIDFILISSY